MATGHVQIAVNPPSALMAERRARVAGLGVDVAASVRGIMCRVWLHVRLAPGHRWNAGDGAVGRRRMVVADIWDPVAPLLITRADYCPAARARSRRSVHLPARLP